MSINLGPCAPLKYAEKNEELRVKSLASADFVMPRRSSGTDMRRQDER